MASKEQHYKADRNYTRHALADARGYNTDVDHTGSQAEAIYQRLARASRLMRPWSTDGTPAQSREAVEYLNEITTILSEKIGPASRCEFNEQDGTCHHEPKTANQLDREINTALSASQKASYQERRRWGLPAELAFKAATEQPLKGARSSWKPRKSR